MPDLNREPHLKKLGYPDSMTLSSPDGKESVTVGELNEYKRLQQERIAARDPLPGVSGLPKD